MNTTRMYPSALRTTFIVTSSMTLTAILLLIGLWLGRMGWGMAGVWPGNMMSTNPNYGTGMMQNGMMGGVTMMNQGMMNGGNMMGAGMMNGNAMMNGGTMIGSSMMENGGLYANATSLSLEAARQALDPFLQSYKNEDLAVGEIMIFDNHAYAEIVEQSTGIGAMEMLVDPVTLAVTPEHGPNMMWNLKYGTMAGYSGGMIGGPGMMGNFTQTQPADIPSEMPVTVEEAIESAQRYLDTYLPGTQVENQANPFYGYYTLHILRDSNVIGMLSVNGFTRQVFPHTWHGDFIEMRGE